MVDLGTGDGRSALARAAAEPSSLVLGLDACRDGLLVGAARADRQRRRNGLANVRFVVASAEALPTELDGLVDELTVHFPWGSLLRGLLEPDPRILAGLARLLRPGRRAVALLSVTPRDQRPDLPILEAALAERLASAFDAQGLRLVDWRSASAAEIAVAHSTWASRLGAGRDRPVWRLEVVRAS